MEKSQEFWNTFNFLQKSQYWSKGKMQNYQLKELQKLIHYVYKNVPYYTDLFNKHNIRPEQIESLSDIQRIPFLTRDVLKRDTDKFFATNIPRESLIKKASSGSSGDPLEYYADKETRDRLSAFTYHYLTFLGLNPDIIPTVRLRSDKVPEELTNKGEYWYLRDKNQLAMSSLHISEDTTYAYVKKLNEFKPQYIVVYPSAITLLARYMTVNNLSLDFQLNCIYCTAEPLYEPQREFLSATFKCPVYSSYGHTEAIIVGASCPHSRFIHILPQYGICELINSDGSAATQEGNRGEMVGTGFINYAFPLIRYKTGDIGVLTTQTCRCGRNCLLLKVIEGRVQDYAVNKKNNMVSMTSLQDYFIKWASMDSWLSIHRWQIYQDTPGELVFKVVKSKHSKESDEELEAKIINGFTKVFSDSFDVSVVFVDEIKEPPSGKRRYIEQKLTLHF